jgi:tape measure domain-containing protein
MAAKQETRVVKIVVDGRQAKKATDVLKKGFKDLNRSTKTISNSIVGFQQGIHSLIAFLGIREFASLADEYTNLNSRLKLVLGSTEDFKEVHKDLLSTANETATSVGKLGKAYVDLRLKVKSVKMSHEDTLTVVRAMAQSFRVSGSTAKEASGATLQLMQALASGRLQGDELRALRENNILLLHTIEEEFRRVKKLSKDVILDIKELGASGALTPVIILNALKRAAPQFEAQAAKIDKTFSFIFNKWRNNIVALFGKLESTGSLKPLKDMLFSLADSVQSLVEGFGTFVAVFVGGKLLSAVRAFNKDMAIMNGILMRNPFVAVAGAVAIIVVAFREMNRSNTEVNGKLVNMLDLAKNIAVVIKDRIVSVFSGFFTTIKGAFSGITLGPLQEFVDMLLNIPEAIWLSLKALKEFIKLFSDNLMKVLVAAPKYFVGMKKYFSISEHSKGKRMMDEAVVTLKSIGVKDFEQAIQKIKHDMLNLGNKSHTKNFAEFIKSLASAFSKTFGVGIGEVHDWLNGILKDAVDKSSKIEKKVKQTTKNITSDIQDKVKNFNDYLKEGLDKGKADFENWGKLVENLGVNAFKSLEDTLVGFVSKGKFEIKSLTDSILADFARIQIRRNITIPLYNAFAAALGGGGDGISRPTGSTFLGGPFSAAEGDMGAFPAAHAVPYGAGPIPTYNQATRGAPSRAIGAVNITNNSGTKAKVTETTGPDGLRQVNVTIDRRIDEYFSTGKGDKTMRTAYGMRRVGAR